MKNRKTQVSIYLRNVFKIRGASIHISKDKILSTAKISPAVFTEKNPGRDKKVFLM